jgi:hypothetical protein
MALDRETWRFINSFAPWLSAIGTLAAVITSLYLATASRTRLRIRAFKSQYSLDLRIVPVLPEDQPDEFFLTFSVTNSRDKEVFVQDVYWKIGGVRINQRLDLNRFGSQHDPDMSALPGLVGRVPAHLTVNAGEFRENQLALLAPALLNTNTRIKVGARTSTGRCFENKIDRALEDWLRTAAKEVAE